MWESSCILGWWEPAWDKVIEFVEATLISFAFAFEHLLAPSLGSRHCQSPVNESVSLSRRLDSSTWYQHDFSTKSRVPIKAGMQVRAWASDPKRQHKQTQLEIAPNGIVIFSTMCPLTFWRWTGQNLPWELSPCPCPTILNTELRNLQKERRQRGRACREATQPHPQPPPRESDWMLCLEEADSKAPVSALCRN